MAGFRTFATGEVLTAANVNDFLMKQSVMVFADDAARTAALGAEVTEGMLTYNLATDQLEVFDGAAFVLAAPEPPAGIGSNVVQTVKTDTFSTSSATFVTVTGLTAIITPSSATAKILIIAQVGSSISGGDGDNGILSLAGGNAATYIGDAGGANQPRGIAGVLNNAFSLTNAYNRKLTVEPETLVFLDSPASASAVTYSVQGRISGSGTLFINRAGNDANNADRARVASSITVIEVAA